MHMTPSLGSLYDSVVLLISLSNPMLDHSITVFDSSDLAPPPRRGAKFTARCARSADACNIWRALRARRTPNVENFIARCARAADACNVWRALLACCTPNDWRALRALCRCTYHTSLPSRLRWLGWTRMDTLGNSGPKWQFWSKVTILAQSDNSGPK